MADLELESLGNGDGNNYLLRDNTKIPLSGSNAISGSLIPATTDAYDLGGPSYQWNNTYIKSLTINNWMEIIGYKIARTNNAGEFLLCGGTDWVDGGTISLWGANHTDRANNVQFGSGSKRMDLYPSGTWTWTGQAVQLISDQRLKQQIAEIDDKLLDAWEDVNLVQFKYNDAVKEKSDNARLHTGYVVQQIDEACKSHNVDISKYGLYCHEEHPEETEEVEVEQKDGTKTKETKVIREASEHYSLRYTETLVVECAYLRRENNKLKQQMLQYTESLSKLEERLKALEQTSK